MTDELRTNRLVAEIHDDIIWPWSPSTRPVPVNILPVIGTQASTADINVGKPGPIVCPPRYLKSSWGEGSDRWPKRCSARCFCAVAIRTSWKTNVALISRMDGRRSSVRGTASIELRRCRLPAGGDRHIRDREFGIADRLADANRLTRILPARQSADSSTAECS